MRPSISGMVAFRVVVTFLVFRTNRKSLLQVCLVVNMNARANHLPAFALDCCHFLQDAIQAKRNRCSFVLCSKQLKRGRTKLPLFNGIDRVSKYLLFVCGKTEISLLAYLSQIKRVIIISDATTYIRLHIICKVLV